MTIDGFEGRLAAAAGRLDDLRSRLEAGAPWPLAARFDHDDEARWGPRETLAHVEEMLAYWLGESERILDGGDAGEPASFGRPATDTVRLAIIERDRTLPIRELCARVDMGIERWRRRWAELDADARQRTGLHVLRGPVTVAEVAERFVAGHLDEHLDQLDQATTRSATG